METFDEGESQLLKCSVPLKEYMASLQFACHSIESE